VTLPAKLTATFTPLLRSRGNEHVRLGRVEIVTATPSLVQARVRDAARSQVAVRAVTAGALDMQCSCEYARDHGNCEHIWAVLVDCDRNGTLPSLPDEAFLAEGRSLREAEEAAERARQAREAAVRAEQQRLRTEALQAVQQAANAAPIAPPTDPRPWVRQLRSIRTLMTPTLGDWRTPAVFPADTRIIYTVDAPRSAQREHGLVVEVGLQSPLKKADTWGPARPIRLSRAQWLAAPDPIDREIAQLLLGSTSDVDVDDTGRAPQRFVVAADAIDITLRRMCDSGRCRLRTQPGSRETHELAWDGDDPWHLHLAIVTEPDSSEQYALTGWLQRRDERLTLESPALHTADGVLIANGHAGRVVDHGAHFLSTAITGGTLREIARADATDLLAELYALPQLPPLDVPEDLDIETVERDPTPRLSLRQAPSTPWSAPGLEASLAYNYGGAMVSATNASAGIVHLDNGTVIRRNHDAELIMMRRLEQAGFRYDDEYGQARGVLRAPESRGMAAAVELVREGWWVEFDGQAMRTAGPLSMQVRSGIDWFDVEATVEFGGASARLPELLAALRRGERTIRLSDNALGVLDEQWMDRTGLLAATGTVVDGNLRFAANQLGILDVLLGALPEPDVDAAFAHARTQLVHFDGVHAAEPPASFVGTLRDYQKEGLGWLNFLRTFGFGGCLADDMGLGKTVQVLALLEARREAQAGPSLVVVPRSLVFNWLQEAERFAPSLRILVHQGPDRDRDARRMTEFDVVITTYGTLRRDALLLRDVEFDYLVVDEAQAIKNAATASAKAARVVRARHRIAMSGTPIENSIRELWSLLDFLNPGLLGKASVFAAHLRQLDVLESTPREIPAPDSVDENEEDGAEAGEVDTTASDAEEGRALREASRVLLARAVRPYILRRTKAQVTPELPERLEQTLLVDLSAKERARYDELRDHYRTSLLRQIGPDGIGRHRMHVLEALLRLRQAACHPGLLDPARRSDPSSKVDLLLSRVTEAVAESHKVLVFSQFTSLLSLVRDRFDSAGLTYAYLDGSTTDRQRVVAQFQEDPACGVFLISLKAGGVGLNLTAADYVYLLDPWWNPAVEAQAIDRAHRIGQTRRVFASRLIARDTVEEKVLALQERKRDLADAIISADESLLSSLGREELEMLLS